MMTLKAGWVFGFGIMTASAALAGGAKNSLESQSDRINYSVGYQIGGDFKRQKIELNGQALLRGIEDALKDRPAISESAMRNTLVELKKRLVKEQKKRLVKEQKKRQQDKTFKLKEQGKKFMEANAGKKGVKVLPGGLQYQILARGKGKTPGPRDTVTVHYRGSLVDGREFDSSYRHNKPVNLPVSGVIEGWRLALTHMKEGDKWKVYIPPQLGYRDRGGPLAFQTLIFEMELISVNQKEI